MQNPQNDDIQSDDAVVDIVVPVREPTNAGANLSRSRPLFRMPGERQRRHFKLIDERQRAGRVVLSNEIGDPIKVGAR